MKRRNFIFKSVIISSTLIGADVFAKDRASTLLSDLQENYERGLNWCKHHKALLIVEKGTYQLNSNWINLFQNQTLLDESIKIDGNKVEFSYDVAIDFREIHDRNRQS